MQQIQKVTRQSHNIITFMSKSKMEGVLFFFLNRQRFMHASKLNRNSRVAFLTSTTTSIFGKKSLHSKVQQFAHYGFQLFIHVKVSSCNESKLSSCKDHTKTTSSCICHIKNYLLYRPYQKRHVRYVGHDL